MSRVGAAKASELDEAALRAELVRLLPPASRKNDHGVWHPSEKYPGWCDWSPSKLVEKQLLYERYVENWYRAHQDAARPASEPVMTDEEAVANGYILPTEEDKELVRKALEAMDLPFEEFEPEIPVAA